MTPQTKALLDAFNAKADQIENHFNLIITGGLPKASRFAYLELTIETTGFVTEVLKIAEQLKLQNDFIVSEEAFAMDKRLIDLLALRHKAVDIITRSDFSPFEPTPTPTPTPKQESRITVQTPNNPEIRFQIGISRCFDNGLIKPYTRVIITVRSDGALEFRAPYSSSVVLFNGDKNAEFDRKWIESLTKDSDLVMEECSEFTNNAKVSEAVVIRIPIKGYPPVFVAWMKKLDTKATHIEVRIGTWGRRILL